MSGLGQDFGRAIENMPKKRDREDYGFGLVLEGRLKAWVQRLRVQRGVFSSRLMCVSREAEPVRTNFEV